MTASIDIPIAERAAKIVKRLSEAMDAAQHDFLAAMEGQHLAGSALAANTYREGDLHVARDADVEFYRARVRDRVEAEERYADAVRAYEQVVA